MGGAWSGVAAATPRAEALAVWALRDQGPQGSGRLRLVDRMLVAKSDRQPVPQVDRADQDGEVDDLLLAELRAQLLERLGRRVRLGNQRHRLRPRQSGALARRIDLGFAPRIEQIKPLFPLAAPPRILAVHIEAVGGGVDLRLPHLHEFHQALLEPALSYIGFDAEQGFVAVGRHGPCGQSFRFHGSVLSLRVVSTVRAIPPPTPSAAAPTRRILAARAPGARLARWRSAPRPRRCRRRRSYVAHTASRRPSPSRR